MAEKEVKTPENEESKEKEELSEAELEKVSGGLNPQPLPPSPPDPGEHGSKHTRS